MGKGSVGELVMVDLDRTLLDVDQAMERLCGAIINAGGDAERAMREKREYEERGASFDPLSVLNVELRDKVKEVFIRRKDLPLLYPDSAGFLGLLRSERIEYCLITYAVSTEWQRMKLESAGCSDKVIILDNPEKGKYIAGRLQSGEGFEFGNPRRYVSPERICLIDDKEIAFFGLPENCRGFWIQRQEKKRTGADSIGNNIQIINSLADLGISGGELKKL